MLERIDKRLAMELIAEWATTLKNAAMLPLCEICGRLTAPVLRDWVRRSARDTQATRCAVMLDADRRTVTAMLLANDDEVLYGPQGRRLAAVFSARFMDDEMKALFRAGPLVCIPLNFR